MTDSEQHWESWVRRLAEGDPEVANEFWGRYGARLQGLAARYLSTGLRRREGPEDVVQSVCRTFFRRVQIGKFELADSESLWRLLCAITVTKVRQKARFHRREKRGLHRERHFEPAADDSRSPELPLQDAEPTPAEAAEFADELQQLLGALDQEEQRLVELRLEQYTYQEIAEKLGCSQRTVRRILKRVQARLHTALEESITNHGKP